MRSYKLNLPLKKKLTSKKKNLSLSKLHVGDVYPNLPPSQTYARDAKVIYKWHPKDAVMTKRTLKVLGKSVGGVECKSAKLWGEMVRELSDGVTETQILQKLWKK